jgi:hypothetical protein
VVILAVSALVIAWLSPPWTAKYGKTTVEGVGFIIWEPRDPRGELLKGVQVNYPRLWEEWGLIVLTAAVFFAQFWGEKNDPH